MDMEITGWEHLNMIDLVLIERRWKTAVRLCRTFQGADISSDHSLVLCNIQLKLKHTVSKRYEKKRNIETLKNVETRLKYGKEITAGIERANTKQLSIDDKAVTLNKIIIQAVEATVPFAEKPNKKWITEETLKLAKEKREAKLKVRGRSEGGRVQEVM